MADIRILSSGLYSTIQDLGRFGHAVNGVPQSGVMDSFSAIKANVLLNNPKNYAVLEITMTGPKMKFHVPTIIAVCGAVFNLDLDGKSLDNDKAYPVSAGEILNFGRLKAGMRAYIAFKGGLDLPLILGSRSMYEGITPQFRLQKGDTLVLHKKTVADVAAASRVRFRESDSFSNHIDVLEGPEFDGLTSEQKSFIKNQDFTIDSAANRMAIPLKEKMPNRLKGILTGPVLPGTVQLTPAGNLIVLMRDCQVTGGYSRILQLTETGISRFSQLIPGRSMRFKLAGI